MKILMISNHLGVQSGVQRYVQNLLLNLDLTRYQVDLFVGLCPPDQASCARHWKQPGCISLRCRTIKKPVSAHCTSI